MSIWEVDGIPLTLLKHVTLTAIVLVWWATAWRGPQGRPRQVAYDAIGHSATVFLLALLPVLVPGVGWALIALLFPLMSNAVLAMAVSAVLLLVSVTVEAIRARARTRAVQQDAPRPTGSG